MARIYLPGAGMVDLSVARLDRAVREYDERLSFRLNEETGDYCAWIKTPRPHGPANPPEIPVLGFGPDVPPADVVLQRLMASDTRRHGDRVLHEIDRNNERIQQDKRLRADEARDETAEKLEFLMRNAGKSPVVKSLRPNPKRTAGTRRAI